MEEFLGIPAFQCTLHAFQYMSISIKSWDGPGQKLTDPLAGFHQQCSRGKIIQILAVWPNAKLKFIVHILAYMYMWYNYIDDPIPVY